MTWVMMLSTFQYCWMWRFWKEIWKQKCCSEVVRLSISNSWDSVKSFCHDITFKSFQSLFCENMMSWCKKYEQLNSSASSDEKEKCYCQYCVRLWREQFLFRLISEWFKNKRESAFCERHSENRKVNERRDSTVLWEQNESQLIWSCCAARSWEESCADSEECTLLLMITEAAVFAVKLKSQSFFSECRNRVTVILLSEDVIFLDFMMIALICSR